MIQKTPRVFLLLTTLLLVASCAPKTASKSSSDPCLLVWGAFDIGSGSTKLKVARLNVCTKVIAETLLEQSEKVDFEEVRARSPHNQLGLEVVERGVRAIEKLKKSAQSFKPAGFSAVATGAFRKASDGKDAVALLQTRTGVDIDVISQSEEALLGFEAAAAVAKLPTSSVVVWDIGGATMQISALQRKGKLVSEQGDLASVTFKKGVIQEILKKDPVVVTSPNPLDKNAMNRAVSLARRAARNVNPQIRKRLQDPQTRVLGIGGVHFNSVAGQLGAQNVYRQKELWNFLPTLVGKTDAEIGGDYADTQFTNLILVLGFMQELGIEEVIPLRVNLADGLLARRARS